MSNSPAFVSAPRIRARARIILFALAALVALAVAIPLALAQDNPHVTGVDPATGKANDTVTVAGENLGKAKVVAMPKREDVQTPAFNEQLIVELYSK